MLGESRPECLADVCLCCGAKIKHPRGRREVGDGFEIPNNYRLLIHLWEYYHTLHNNKKLTMVAANSQQQFSSWEVVTIAVGKSNSKKLENYIRSLPDFEIYTQIGGNYGHVGATLAGAILQANNNYERNVRKRIAHIRKEYAQETDLVALKQLLKKMSARQFLQWNGTRKPKAFLDLVDLLNIEGVNTEDDLRSWLQRDDTSAKLQKIRFVGPKTVDYLKILVGLPNAAIDRHLFGFIGRAGLGKLTYERARELVHQTADLMKVNRAHLDHSIWRYMSSDKTRLEECS